MFVTCKQFLVLGVFSLASLPLLARSTNRGVECLTRGDRVVLKFRGSGKTYRGQEKIKLKKLLFRNCRDESRVLDHHTHFLGVKLLAKSRFGFARVKLRVGRDFTVSKRIGRIRKSDERRFHKIFLKNPKSDDFGPWQLWMRGLIKVKKIVLFFEKEDHDHWDHWDHFEFLKNKDLEFKPLS